MSRNYYDNPFKQATRSPKRSTHANRNDDASTIDMAKEALSVFKAQSRERQSRKKKSKDSSKIPRLLEFGTVHITQTNDSSDIEELFNKKFDIKQNHKKQHSPKPHKIQERHIEERKVINESSEIHIIEDSSTGPSAIMKERDIPSIQLDVRDAKELHTLDIAEDIIMPPKGSKHSDRKKESESESMSLTFTMLTLDNNNNQSNLKQRRHTRRRKIKAPKLAYDPPPITNDSEVPDTWNGKVDREMAYQAFCNTHKNEISTPEEIEQYIIDYIRKNNRK